MLYILFSVLCSVIIGNLLQLFSKGKRVDIFVVFLGNYFLAAVFSWTQIGSGEFSFGIFELLFGLLTGFFFLYNFVVYQKNIALNGLSLSVGVMRVAVVIPTFMSVLFFSDILGKYNALGVGIIVVAFGFITKADRLSNILWLLLLFIVAGFTDSTLKIYAELGAGNQASFVFILFTSSFICTLFWVIKTKRIFSPLYLLYGLVLGIPNQLSTRFFLQGLESVPATIAYPLTASTIVIFSFISDLLFWRKRFSVKQRIAIALLIVGIVLINLR